MRRPESLSDVGSGGGSKGGIAGAGCIGVGLCRPSGQGEGRFRLGQAGSPQRYPSGAFMASVLGRNTPQSTHSIIAVAAGARALPGPAASLRAARALDALHIRSANSTAKTMTIQKMTLPIGTLKHLSRIHEILGIQRE